MESENVADIPIDPIANEENPTPQPNAETLLPEVFDPTVDNSTENIVELDPSDLKTELTSIDASNHDVVPTHSNHQIDEEISKIPNDIKDELQPADSDIDTKLTTIINQVAEQKERLTIESLEITYQQKKKKKKEAKLLAREQRQQKINSESQFDNKTRTVRIGSFETEIGSETEEEFSSSDDDRSEISLVSFKKEFFSRLGEVPSISNISLDQEETSSINLKKSIKEDIDPDLKGKFVNSITAETESETESTEVSEKETFEVEVEVEEFVESTSSDLELLLDTDDYPPLTEKTADTNFLLGDTEESRAVMTEFIIESESVIINRLVKKEEADYIMNFLYKLLNNVVNRIEKKADTTNILDKLGIMKMITKLKAIVDDHQIEQSINAFLNTKTADCYRRLRRRYGFVQLSESENVAEYHRYKYALAQLDHLNQKKAIAKKKASYMTSSVLLEMAAITNISASLGDRIEERARDIIVRKDSELLKKAVQSDFRLMRQIQDEISETRMNLIKRQHTLAVIIEQTLDFEKISDNLTTSEFLSVQQDVMRLTKRLSERDDRLQTIHHRCNKELKRSVYYVERRDFVMNSLASNKEKLADLLVKRDKLRKKLCQLKVEHIRNINQKKELSFRAGLLYKPALLIDYDKSEELVTEKRRKILELRNTVDNLVKRLSVAVPGPKKIASEQPIRKL